jgi:CRISPR-associated protein Cas2
MPLTLLVTRDVAGRYRGFLSSVMAEVAPGVYVSPDISAAVRERIWAVMEAWWGHEPGTAAILVYADRSATGRMSIRTLGTAPVEWAEVCGMHLVVKRAQPAAGEHPL